MGCHGAPEVRTGLSAADSSLGRIFAVCLPDTDCSRGGKMRPAGRPCEVFAKGIAEEPEQRCTLEDLERVALRTARRIRTPARTPPARFWTEEQVVRFHDRDYRIVARLGSGGVGTTFKVVEIDRSTKEDLGTYVAKVGHQCGNRQASAESLQPGAVAPRPSCGAFRHFRGGAANGGRTSSWR